MEDNDDEARDEADDDGDENREDEISGVRVRVEIGDGEAGVGAGVVAGDDGVVDPGDVVPGVTDHLWRIATAADVDHQGCHHRLVRGCHWPIFIWNNIFTTFVSIRICIFLTEKITEQNLLNVFISRSVLHIDVVTFK